MNDDDLTKLRASADIRHETLEMRSRTIARDGSACFTAGDDGGFRAAVHDEAFVQRIRTRARRNGRDIIRAKVRRTQRLTKDGLKADYEIVEVVEHRNASPKIQLKMDFDGNKPTGK